jgi:hypothetical protein
LYKQCLWRRRKKSLCRILSEYGNLGISMKERQSGYGGPAEIWIDDAKVLDVHLRLARYVEVDEIRTGDGRVERFESAISWDGEVLRLTDHDRFTLVGKDLALKLPSGRTGNAVLDTRFGKNWLRGSNFPPFD